MPRFSCLLAVLCALVALPQRGGAGTSATPVFHGALGFTPARGRLDRNRARGYLATLDVRQWALIPEPNSNGISPGDEPIIIAFGEATWRLEPGALSESKRGGTWSFKAKGPHGSRAIKRLRVRRELDGSFSFRFVVSGIDGSQLDTADPVCIAFAFIIGDDDAFTGVSLSSPTFNSRKLRVLEPCTAEEWLWAFSGSTAVFA
jgi:hypothetical protein